jgi:hypothetical protein
MRLRWQNDLDVEAARMGATAFSGNGPAKLILKNEGSVNRVVMSLRCAFTMRNARRKDLSRSSCGHSALTSQPMNSATAPRLLAFSMVTPR